MKKILFALMMLAFISPAFSQEEEQTQTEDKPVKNTFEAVTLIDNQTVMTPFKGALELQIQHRFSLIENIHNLYGIYGSANTRLGLNYGITDRIMFGIGTVRYNQLADIQWKYKILQQTKSNSMPITLAYYGNITINLRDSSTGVFGPTNGGRFKEIHRLAYLNQLIVARKFTDRFSFQIAPTLFYFNSVPMGYKNLNLSISAGGRYNVFGAHSVMLEYNQLITKQDSIVIGSSYVKEQPQPNVAIGWEIGTATHCFQVFIANFDKINGQYDLLYNTNDFKKRKYLFGFNITVRF
ncbi:MAG: hypothetical protein EHM93_08500 [Bacteroidales bacterium]|nr:MAG: hypothetical protein EHM93_08500 [Bacteroidales bacterium]